MGFYASYPDADKTTYDVLFNTLHSLQISDDVGSSTLAEIKRRKDVLGLSELSFRVGQGLAERDDLIHYISEKITNEQPTEYDLPLQEVTDDLEEIIDNVYKDSGLRWRLDCLNKSLGSIRDGDFGFVFARPETGKTTWLASEVTSMLYQAQRPVVWFSNEEQGTKVMMRIYQAYFGVTMEQLMSNPKRFRDEFINRTDGNLFLYDGATISRKDVEQIIERKEPCLVVYDQLTKIKGFKADRQDLILGDIFQWARELAKGNHAAIGVSQADGSAEGIRYLTMEHVANAKTAVQAEADWILGIGRSHDPGAENIRYLSISKNKLFGDKDSIPDLRHGRFETVIRAELARYEDTMRYD